MPLISIIIPTYNSAKTIENALKSIISQYFKNFEVLIMDGISTDATLEIVKTFSDKRIIIHSEKDMGVYDAMNKGIEKSSGKWLYFLGCDDFLYSNDVLGKMSDTLQYNDYDFVYGNAIFTSSNTVYNGEFNLEKLLDGVNICHQAIFYNKEIFSRIGLYNTKYNILADYDLNIRCFSHPEIKIKYINEIISEYNDASGLSFDHKDKNFATVYKSGHLNSKIKQLEYKLNNLEKIYSYYELFRLIRKKIKISISNYINIIKKYAKI